MANQPFDVGGVQTYAVLPPEQQWPAPYRTPPIQPMPGPYFVPIPARDMTPETIRGLELRIDALVKRCDELERIHQVDMKTLDRHFDQRVDALSVRLDALEENESPEPEDYMVIYPNGSRTVFVTLERAKALLLQSEGSRLLRLVEPEAKESEV